MVKRLLDYIITKCIHGKVRQAYSDLPHKYRYDYEKAKQTLLKINCILLQLL